MVDKHPWRESGQGMGETTVLGGLMPLVGHVSCRTRWSLILHCEIAELG